MPILKRYYAVFPFAAVSFFVGCQTYKEKDVSADISLSLPMQEAIVSAAEEKPWKGIETSPKSNEISVKLAPKKQSAQLLQKADTSKNLVNAKKLFEKKATYIFATDDPNQTDSEGAVGDNDAPPDLDGGEASKNIEAFDGYSDHNSNPLMCEESAFYTSWKSQFDTKWLALNASKYHRAEDLQKSLRKARTAEYISLVYPSIEKTGYDFPFVMNDQVLGWIGYFTGRGRRHFVEWLQRGQILIPKMQRILEGAGLPKDLVYLSMIESGFAPKSLSYAGAVGVWQFMPQAARENGLLINDYIDERRDPIKSTVAAAKYLSYSYETLGSWHLAAASYNCGVGCTQRYLRNYGASSSFFQLTSLGVVNKQTADYVPKIIAAMVVAKNADKFGFDTNQRSIETQTKILPLKRSIRLSDLAAALQIDKQVLSNLNPAVRLGITPPQANYRGEAYPLIVPYAKYEVAIASLNDLPDAPAKQIVIAPIKRRESVAAFAARYRLSVKALLAANTHLHSRSHLQKGQLVYVPVSLGTGVYDALTKKNYKTPSKKHFRYAKLSKNNTSKELVKKKKNLKKFRIVAKN